MEEVDRIIIHTLRDIGCEMDGNILSLSQFTSEMIVDAVVSCLENINSTISLPKTLPNNTAAKFHVCASIAEACKTEGYSGDVGYQTFLYSNISEVRRVLMHLIDKLPRDIEKTAPVRDDPLSKLKYALSTRLREQLGDRLRPGHVKSIPFLSYPMETGILVPGKQVSKNPQEWREYCQNELKWFSEQVPRPESIMCSVVTLLDGGASGLIDQGAISNRESVPPKPLPRTMPSSWLSINQEIRSLENDKSTELPIPAKRSQVPSDSMENKKKKIKSDIAESKRKIEDTNSALNSLNKKLSDIKSEISKVSPEEVRKAVAKQSAISLLLDNDRESAFKLAEDDLERTKERIKSLKVDWERRKAPSVEKITRLKEIIDSHQNQNEQIVLEITDSKKKINELNKEVTMKNLLKSKLDDDLAKLPKEINRSMYTKRILEIIGNIKKQKDDIDKILCDTRKVQKEISLMTGRLERSFAVTNELIFQNARKDEASRRAYKLLATLHSDCSDIVSLIQETGVVVREISDLNEQIEVESAKKTAASLERITNDLNQMKQKRNC